MHTMCMQAAIAQLYTHASSHTIHTQSSMSTTMSLVYLWPRKAPFEQRVTIMAIPNRTRKLCCCNFLSWG